MNDDDEQPEREPVPRAWREEFDGLKPIRPHARRKPVPEPQGLREPDRDAPIRRRVRDNRTSNRA